MKKLELNELPITETSLQSLFQARKAPLQKEALQQILWKLTLTVAKKAHFYSYIYLKSSSSEELVLQDIEKASLLVGDDQLSYLPIFTGKDKLEVSMISPSSKETLVEFSKEELRDFLLRSSAIQAISLNPGSDDLFLFASQLQNFIQIEKEGY